MLKMFHSSQQFWLFALVEPLDFQYLFSAAFCWIWIKRQMCVHYCMHQMLKFVLFTFKWEFVNNLWFKNVCKNYEKIQSLNKILSKN